MRLTHYTNYALRTLMYAAMRRPDLVRVQDVSDAYGISRAHLVKCVHQLGLWGYLENVRGRNGGFRLARAPAVITVGEIARKTEDCQDLVECFNPAVNTCPMVTVCRLKTTFQRAQLAFMAVLDEVTLADLIANADELAPLIGLDQAKLAAE